MHRNDQKLWFQVQKWWLHNSISIDPYFSPSFGFEATSRLPWRPGVEAWVPLARRSRMNNWKAGGMGVDGGYGDVRCWNFRMFFGGSVDIFWYLDRRKLQFLFTPRWNDRLPTTNLGRCPIWPSQAMPPKYMSLGRIWVGYGRMASKVHFCHFFNTHLPTYLPCLALPCPCLALPACLSVCLSVSLSLSIIYINMYIYIYIYLFIYIYIYHIYIRTYIHT